MSRWTFVRLISTLCSFELQRIKLKYQEPLLEANAWFRHLRKTFKLFFVTIGALFLNIVFVY